MNNYYRLLHRSTFCLTLQFVWGTLPFLRNFGGLQDHIAFTMGCEDEVIRIGKKLEKLINSDTSVSLRKYNISALWICSVQNDVHNTHYILVTLVLLWWFISVHLKFIEKLVLALIFFFLVTDDCVVYIAFKTLQN